MKERIFAALKAKFPGVNANILDRIAASLAKTVTTEEQVATAVEGVTKEQIDVIEAYGDSRATEAQQSAVRNYETKHGLKDGKKVDDKSKQTGTTTTEDDDTPAWAKALINSNKQLTERLNKMEGERTSANRKAELDAIINKLPENQRKGYQRISVDSLTDEEFATLKGEVTTEVEDLVKQDGAKGVVFGRPLTSNGKTTQHGSVQEATDAEATEVVNRLNII